MAAGDHSAYRGAVGGGGRGGSWSSQRPFNQGVVGSPYRSASDRFAGDGGAGGYSSGGGYRYAGVGDPIVESGVGEGPSGPVAVEHYRPSRDDIATGDDTSPGGARKRRVHYSCDECHRRKQKCNRQQPCQHCCSRGVPQRCRFSAAQEAQRHQIEQQTTYDKRASPREQVSAAYSPSESSSVAADVKPGGVRAHFAASSELNDLKLTMQEGFAEILHALRRSDAPVAPAHSQPGSLSTPVSFSTPSVLGKRKIEDGDGEEVQQQQLQSAATDDLLIHPSLSVSTSRGSKLLDMLSVNNAAGLYDPTRNIDSRSSIDTILVEISSRDARGSGPISQGLLACLPSPERSEELFKAFLDHHESVRYPLSIDSLRRCMARLPVIRQRGCIAADEVTSFSVIMAMLSQAVLKLDAEEVEAHELTAMYRQARALNFASIKCLCTSDIVGQMDMEKSLAHHLASRFLVLDRRLNEAYMCSGSGIRCAMASGLHRIDPTAGNRSAKQIEEERLLWCAMRYDERSYAILTERPSAIDDRICHTTPPPPSATLSAEDAAFVRYRHDLATLQGRMIILLQSGDPKGINIRDVLAMDEELVAFRRRIPSDDLRQAENFSPRFSLHSHTLQTRLALLRPFFLRTMTKGASSRMRQAHADCRRACVEAACEDVRLREELVRNVGSVLGLKRVPGFIRRHIRTPRWFNSLVICGAYLLTSQQENGGGGAEEGNVAVGGDRALLQQARHHLHAFVDLAEDRQRKEGQRDAALDREVEILRMFMEKSSERAVARLKSEGKRHKASDGDGERAAAVARGVGPTADTMADHLSHADRLQQHRRQLIGDGAQASNPSTSSPVYSTPASTASPAGSAINGGLNGIKSGGGGGDGGGNGLDQAGSSSVQSGEDLQAILDAWFQSDSNLSGNEAGAELPSVFAAKSMNGGTGGAGKQVGVRPAVGGMDAVMRQTFGGEIGQTSMAAPAATQPTAMAGSAASWMAPNGGGFAVGFDMHEKVGMSAQTGDFWQG